MKIKGYWLHVCLLAAVVAATGCGAGTGGGSGVTSSPGPAVLTMYNSSVNFGDVAVGNSTTLGMTLSNTGASSLTLQQNSAPGPGFATSGIGQGVTLGPGQYVTLAVSFGPSVSGQASGTVSLTSSTSNSPINLPLTGNGVVATHSATVNWAASKSVVVGYNIYRTPASYESWAKLNSSPVLSTSYTDWDVQGGDSYLFTVTSVSAANVESAFSDATLATIPSP
jgi:hypothetical protein